MLPRAGRSGGVLTRRSLACSLVDVENEPSPAPYRVFWFTWCERFKPDYLNGLVCSHFNTWNSAQHYTRSCWRSTVQTFSSQCEPLCGSRRSTVLSTVWRMRTLLRQKKKQTHMAKTSGGEMVQMQSEWRQLLLCICRSVDPAAGKASVTTEYQSLCTGRYSKTSIHGNAHRTFSMCAGLCKRLKHIYSSKIHHFNDSRSSVCSGVTAKMIITTFYYIYVIITQLQRP